MEVRIYRSAYSTRLSEHAVFRTADAWGAARGGEQQVDWRLVFDQNLDRVSRTLPFDADEAKAAINAHGVFRYLDQRAPEPLHQAEDEALNAFRLRFTVPILQKQADDGADVLGTGTLFTHEDRYFLVTADHILRHDVDDESSALIPTEDVALPDQPRDGRVHTLGRHEVYRLQPPVEADVIVIELLEAGTIAFLEKNWGFLSFDQADDDRTDDRLVISGFLAEGAQVRDEIIHQTMLNLATDPLGGTPVEARLPVWPHDLFLYLEPGGAMVDGRRRTITSLKGLSGGPVWAARGTGPQIWDPSRALRFVGVQSSELKGKWARAVRWDVVRRILRQAEVGFVSPP